MRLTSVLLAGLAALAAPAALAHTGSHPVDGFLSGFSHPFAGLDHMLAMAGVGLWAVRVAPRRAWLLPLVFVAVMALGAGLAIVGLPLACEETGIAASVLLLGALVASMARLGIGHAALLVGLFALFHGHAHGAEMATGAEFAAYAAGFAAATALLHWAGMALGTALLKVPALYRGLGAVMGAGGLILLFA